MSRATGEGEPPGEKTEKQDKRLSRATGEGETGQKDSAGQRGREKGLLDRRPAAWQM